MNRKQLLELAGGVSTRPEYSKIHPDLVFQLMEIGTTLRYGRREDRLQEWIDKARVSFKEIETVLRLLRHEVTADAIKIIMDDLEMFMPEYGK